MKAYIHNYASISRLPSFEKGILACLGDAVTQETQHPDYKEYINPTLIRRMSPVIKMAVASGLRCAQHEADWAGIVLGTGLGCLRDTEVFLKTVLRKDGLAISPTAFIQSTHNTIAGQLALATGNKGYNMTHSQQGISFECALNDAILLAHESEKPVLVGAAEEHTPFLGKLAEAFGLKDLDLAEGASFFTLSTVNEKSLAEVRLTQFFDSEIAMQQVMEEEKPDLILYRNGLHPSPRLINNIPQLDIQHYCGIYSTNSAFGMQLACELVEQNEGTIEGISLASLNKVALLNCCREKAMAVTIIEKLN